MSSYPIRGRTSLIGRAENRPDSLSTVVWGTPYRLRNHLIRRLRVLSSRNSHGWYPGLEVRTTHRAYSGSVGCLHVSLGQLSQISGADSAVSSTSVHVRDRGQPSKCFEINEFLFCDDSLNVRSAMQVYCQLGKYIDSWSEWMLRHKRVPKDHSKTSRLMWTSVLASTLESECHTSLLASCQRG